MKDQFYDIEKIDEFLTGKMPEAEQMALENDLLGNDDLKADMELQSQLRDLVIASSLSEVRAQMQNDFLEQTKKAEKKNKLKVTAVALTCLACALGYFFLGSKDKKEGFKNKEVFVSSVLEDEKVVKAVPESGKDKEESVTSHSSHLNEGSDKEPSLVTEKEKVKVLTDEVQTAKEEGEASNGLISEVHVAKDSVKKVAELVTTTPHEMIEKPERELEVVKKVAKLSFNGELKSVNSSYQESNGTILVIGEVVGGVEPYEYSIYEDDFQESKEFIDLEKGEYALSAKDSEGTVISLGSIEIKESLCVTEYNESFVPAYGNYWEIPVASDHDYEFKVYSVSGIVYKHFFEIGEEPHWSGVSSSGNKATSGFYRYEIKYDTGEQCFGELTIRK